MMDIDFLLLKLEELWPYMLIVASFSYSLPAAFHAVMTKEQVPAAVGWTAIIFLSPFIGASLYYCFGINRISRRWRRLNRVGPSKAVSAREAVNEGIREDLPVDTRLGDSISPFPMTTRNRIQPLWGGREAYPAMIDAIEKAEKTIALQTYIFDTGKVGTRFRTALREAKARGVEIRVLIDAVGSRYSIPSMAGKLKRDGLNVARFLNNYFTLNLPYANLRNHRKVMIVDGAVAFTGGMNIRDEFDMPDGEKKCARDTHFKIEGLLVEQLLAVFEQDWFFTTKEKLDPILWYKPHPAPAMGVDEADGEVMDRAIARAIPSGPDTHQPRNLLMMMGAIASARNQIIICSPYFIPNPELIAAIQLTAQRKVQVDIIVPERSNLRMVDMAANAQLHQLISYGCRVWKTEQPFDHTKMMIVDDEYAYIGSSNLDTRSLRLNFELDVEIYQRELVAALRKYMEQEIGRARQETLASLKGRSYVRRLLERIVWLFSPYL